MFSRKCFAPSTKVMTFDGLSCEMSDVRAGDMLMGDDSGYRVVEEVSSGTDDMYAIEMDSGERLYVNSVHIVTVLARSGAGTYSVEDHALADILGQPREWFETHYMYRKSTNFELFRGKQHAEMQPQSLAYYHFAKTNGYPCTVSPRIPDSVKYAAKSVRIQFLVSLMACYNKLAGRSAATTPQQTPPQPTQTYAPTYAQTATVHPGRSSTAQKQARPSYVWLDKISGCSGLLPVVDRELARSLKFIARSLGVTCFGVRDVDGCARLPRSGRSSGQVQKYIQFVPPHLELKLDGDAAPELYSLYHFSVKFAYASGLYCGALLSDNGRFMLYNSIVVHNTSNLCLAVERYFFARKKCVLVKWKDDTRYDAYLIEAARASGQVKPETEVLASTIASHDGRIQKNIDIISARSLRSIMAELQAYEVIGVDEVQFFNDSVEVLQELANTGKTVIAAGLDADYRGRAFGRICELIPISETVQKLSAICSACGAEAAFTSMYFHDHDSAEAIIDIGGAEKYWPSCRQCKWG